MAINRKFLAENLCDNIDISVKDANRVVDHVFEVIKINLSLGNDVDLSGFGKFMVTERAARTARNPQTGDAIEVPAKLVVKFKPAKGLKDAMKNEDPLGEGETQY